MRTRRVLILLAGVLLIGCESSPPVGPTGDVEHQPTYGQPTDDPLLTRMAAGGSRTESEDGPPTVAAAGLAGTLPPRLGTIDDYIAGRLVDRTGPADAAGNQEQPAAAPESDVNEPAAELTGPQTQPESPEVGEPSIPDEKPARLVLPRMDDIHAPPPAARQVRQPIRPRPSTRPADSSAVATVAPARELDVAPLSGAALTVAGRVFTGDEVVRPIWGELDRLASRTTAQAHQTQAVELIANELRLLITEHLVSIEAERSMSSAARENIDKLLNEKLAERANAMYGGSMRLMKQAWSQQGLDPEKEIATARRQMLVQAYLREKFMPKVHVVRAEAFAYYQANIEQFTQEPRVRLKLITVRPVYPRNVGLAEQDRLTAVGRARDRARQIHDLITTGRLTFDQAAGRHSDSASSDLGLVRRGGLRARKVEDVAFSLPVGQLSEVIEEDVDGDVSFHIATVSESIPLKVVPFGEAVNTIMPRLERQKFNEQSIAYVEQLYKQAGIDQAQIARFIDQIYLVVPKP